MPEIAHTCRVGRELTPGQEAAGRAARARRGELKLSQEELAELAVDVSIRTIRSFENGQRWPQADKLVAIERSLGWRAGYLSDYAATQDHRLRYSIGGGDPDIAAILGSDMSTEDKQRLIGRLRPVSTQTIRNELPDIEQIITGTADPGEGHTEGREIA